MEHLTRPQSPDALVVPVRYWAGAEAAAGRTTENLRVQAPGAATAARLRRAVADAHPGIDAVLARCSLLQAGRRLDDDDELLPDVQVEVLPPFVGG